MLSSPTDAEWDCIEHFLPPRSPQAKPRRHCLRTVFDAIFHLLRAGCPRRYLPSDSPPWQTVYHHLRQFCRTGVFPHLWRGLREAERRRVGKDPHPSAAIMDAQSVKTVEESACISGYNAHACIMGRKRQRYGRYAGSADLHLCYGGFHARHERRARRLLVARKYFLPRLKKIWADAAYRGKELAGWCKAEGYSDLEVVERTPGVRGFAMLPKRWIVERTALLDFAQPAHSRDYERTVQTSETLDPGRDDPAAARTPGTQARRRLLLKSRRVRLFTALQVLPRRSSGRDPGDGSL
jgi:putative transposase